MNDKNSVFFISIPSVNDTHHSTFKSLVQFVQNLLTVVHEKDLLLVVVDSETEDKLKGQIPKTNLISGTIPDTRIRDFSAIQTQAGLFKYRYRPGYLKKSEAAVIEKHYTDWFQSLELAYKKVNLRIEGGNFNYNGENSGITTARIFTDNYENSQSDIISLLKDTLELEHLAILPEVPGEKMGHSDGMVKWLDKQTLAVCDFEPELANSVRQAISQDLKDVEVVLVPYKPEDDYWKGFMNAMGIYVKAMTTENAIYVPQYSMESDDEALDIFKQHTTKEVIPVSVGKLGRTGRSVRTLTWQLTGQEALKVIEKVRQNS